MRSVRWILLVLALPLMAAASPQTGILGDDDPYPLACIDFSGSWKSDEGEQISIVQGAHCRWLKIRTSFDSQDELVTIVPDDKIRFINDGAGLWKGTVRYRWNSKKYATVVETHRSKEFADKTVSELVLLEKVNDNLLLESTFRTTQFRSHEEDCEPRQENFQRVFRFQRKDINRR